MAKRYANLEAYNINKKREKEQMKWIWNTALSQVKLYVLSYFLYDKADLS